MTSPSLIKQPSETRLYTMEFAAMLNSGETIASVSSVTATPVGLTLVDDAVFSGTQAQQKISGGTSGTTYKVTFLVLTTEGNILEGDGILVVKDL